MKTLKALSLFAILMMSGCTIIDTGNNESAIEVAAQNAVTQLVYSTIEKDPKMEEVYITVIEILTKLDNSVDMTPEEISNAVISEVSKHVQGEYKFIINGVVGALFTKYNIGWSDKVPASELHKYFYDLIVAIEEGISEANKK